MDACSEVAKLYLRKGPANGNSVGSFINRINKGVQQRNTFITGSFDSTADFDFGPGVFNLRATRGGTDIFIARYDALGALVYAKSFGGGSGSAQCLDIDNAGNIVITGNFSGTVDFDPGPGTTNLASTGRWGDIFVAKYDASGNYVYAIKMGSDDWDIGYGIAMDDSGNAYITGGYNGSADFDPGAGTSSW